jgi:class 3 adenylate cyclase
MAEAKRKLAAITAADVAGYSRLMGDNERNTLDTLNAYRDVFRNHVADSQIFNVLRHAPALTNRSWK